MRRHGAPMPHTLDGYRERHALYKRDADLQAAHAAHPWILTWDDHEVVNDYADDRDPAHTEPALFLRRRAAAYRAYFEHMPLALPPQGAAMRIHDRYAWGRLAELWTLDCRQYRSHHACADPAHDAGRAVIGCAELADPARTMLGAEQSQWLAQGLAGSTRQWKLLGQSTQMSATGLDTPQGRQTWTDGWDGYPEARRRLLQGIARRRRAGRGGAGRRRAPPCRGRPARCGRTIPARRWSPANSSAARSARAARARPPWRACGATTRTWCMPAATSAAMR